LLDLASDLALQSCFAEARVVLAAVTDDQSEAAGFADLISQLERLCKQMRRKARKVHFEIARAISNASR
jgi:hypothetical protein